MIWKKKNPPIPPCFFHLYLEEAKLQAKFTAVAALAWRIKVIHEHPKFKTIAAPECPFKTSQLERKRNL